MRFVSATCHLEPVQFLFHLMKGIVANLVAVAHGEHGLARGLKGSAMNVAMGGRGIAGISLRRRRSQMCRELFTHGFGNRRLVVREKA